MRDKRKVLAIKRNCFSTDKTWTFGMSYKVILRTLECNLQQKFGCSSTFLFSQSILTRIKHIRGASKPQGRVDFETDLSDFW